MSKGMEQEKTPFFQVSIESLGAVGDGETDDTYAFERAIKLIEANGGGRLIVSSAGGAGGHFRIRPLNLTSHLILHLDENVKISAISDEDSWPLIPPLPSYGQGRDHPGPRYTSVLHGENLVNVTIEGKSITTSILDGQGEYWWKKRREGTDKFTRGHLVEFMHSKEIRMFNLRMMDSPFWTNHFYDCDDVHVQNVHIYAPNLDSRNTDGWDPDSSRNVLIEDSSYHGGDDCVAIKSGWDCYGIKYNRPSVNITIRNVTCDGQFAGIAIGTEMSGGVENVTVENVLFTQANSVAKIKTGNTRGGYVRNITYRNLKAMGEITKFPIHIDMFHYHNTPNPACGKDWRPDTLPKISDIFFHDIDGSNASVSSSETFHFIGMKESPIENVHLQNVYFQSPRNPDAVPWNCTGVNGFVSNQSVQPWPPCREFQVVYDNQLQFNQETQQVQKRIFFDSQGALYLALVLLIGAVAFCSRRTTWNYCRS
mmetsp:Transcript_14748/g.19279  ORF Transcript_14748/g.19279 Transcript_14748/m.19279 type:complete len:481 (-) Transcript_14748:109-1551(-)